MERLSHNCDCEPREGCPPEVSDQIKRALEVKEMERSIAQMGEAVHGIAITWTQAF